MNKKLLAITLVFALLLPLFAGCQNAYATQQSNTTETGIPREEALNIALADAGLTRGEIYDLDIEWDQDQGICHYDVEFEKDGKDYDYEIHAMTGEILRKEVPAAAGQVTPTPEPEVTPNPPVTPEPTPTAPAQRLTKEEAIAIALDHAALTADAVYDLDAEMDRERGVWIYEVDFESGGYEYEYEIHAETGEILRSEKEWD